MDCTSYRVPVKKVQNVHTCKFLTYLFGLQNISNIQQQVGEGYLGKPYRGKGLNISLPLFFFNSHTKGNPSKYPERNVGFDTLGLRLKGFKAGERGHSVLWRGNF